MKTKTILVATAFLFISFCLIPANLQAQDGSLDLSFGTNGKVITTLANANDVATSIALQSDGKILVVGYSNLDIALVRYNSNGSLDNTFDTDGKIITSVGGSTDVGASVAIQSDGKILVAGYTYIGSNNNDFTLVRYNSDGSLDNTFDTDGKTTTPIGSTHDYGSSMAVQSDGKILVGGSSNNGSNSDFALVRYNSDGSLDNTFDTDGKVTTPVGSANDYANSITIQSDGKILVTGSSSIGGKNVFALVRYNSDGTLDNTFDTDGKVTTAVGSSNDVSNAVKVQSDGKIVVVGYTNSSSNNDFGIVRYNSDGSLDNTFDNDGIASALMFSGCADNGTSVFLQSDGKILVAGYSWNGSSDDFSLLRFNNDGSLDNTFDTDGKVTTSLGTDDDRCFSIILQDDGKILMAGASYNNISYDFALVRYNNNILTGTDETKASSVQRITSTYPNPFNSSVVIQFNPAMTNGELSIYNVYGQLVKQIKNISEQTITLQRDNLPSGLYLFHTMQEEQTLTTGRLVITD